MVARRMEVRIDFVIVGEGESLLLLRSCLIGRLRESHSLPQS